MIRGENGLPETVVAEASFVHQVRIRGPGPVESHHLSAQFGLRHPFFAEHGNISFGLEAVTEEITTRDVIVFVDHKVRLDDEIVVAIAVGESDIQNASRGSWEQTKQRGAQRIYGDRNNGSRHFGFGVWNAVCWVATQRVSSRRQQLFGVPDLRTNSFIRAENK